MTTFRVETLSGWGRYPVESCRVYRPERQRGVGASLAVAPTCISRGLGRSYGDAALNPDGVLSHVRLGRFLAFDPASGILECEGGASLASVIDTFLPRGFFPAVTPGTKHVTIGGAIACDVHGKNHHVDGTLAGSVLDFRLCLPSGRVLTCSREENPEAFWATIGGMGLTGAILSARLRLRRVEAAAVLVDYRKTSDLDHTLDAFHRDDDGYRYSVAWIDGLARGRRLGRSVLMRGNDAAARDMAGPDPLDRPRPRALTVPFDAPGGLLNRFTVRAFNALYHARHSDVEGRVVDYESFFYPLDGVGRWNRLYGRRGFVQYQAALPTDGGRDALVALLERISAARRASFLAVLKRLGPANDALLSFPMAGYTLALDIPVRPGLTPFLEELDAITANAGGRVYLAKDATLDAARFQAMYPRSEEFRRVKRELDPTGRLASSLARRIGLA